MVNSKKNHHVYEILGHINNEKAEIKASQAMSYCYLEQRKASLPLVLKNMRQIEEKQEEEKKNRQRK